MNGQRLTRLALQPHGTSADESRQGDFVQVVHHGHGMVPAFLVLLDDGHFQQWRLCDAVDLGRARAWESKPIAPREIEIGGKIHRESTCCEDYQHRGCGGRLHVDYDPVIKQILNSCERCDRSWWLPQDSIKADEDGTVIP